MSAIKNANKEDNMGLWFSEIENDMISYGYKFNDVLFNDRSEYQSVKVIETEAVGRMMLLDDLIMVTDFDEFVYHEVISHIPVCLHKKPEKVVVIGGGDGGTVRELLKHQCIKEIVLCEIDEMVVEASKKFFPDLGRFLNDERVTVRIGDGVAYMQEHAAGELDLVIVDSTDPIGPGEGLFCKDFYRSVSAALKSDGMMVCQSESVWHRPEMLHRIHNNVSAGFDFRKSYIAGIPTYPRGTWSWTVGSKNPIIPEEYDRERFNQVKADLKYLNDQTMLSVFALPNFYLDKLSRNSES